MSPQGNHIKKKESECNMLLAEVDLLKNKLN